MISALKSETNISRMVFLDTETTNTPSPKGAWGGTGKPSLAVLRLGWACFWNRGTEQWREFHTSDTFFEYLEAFIGHGRRPVFIYTYNASFDYQVLGVIQQVAKRKGWKYDRAPFASSVFIFGCDYLGSQVWFLDMGNHIGGPKRPLSDMAAEMGTEKMELDRKRMDDYPDEVVSPYCRRDVEIVRDYMLKWIRFLLENSLGAYRPTLASQCITAYRHRFIDKVIYVHNLPIISVLERESYRGGRNEAFFIGKIPNKVFKLDVNSFHPYIMKEKKLPYRLVRAGNHLDVMNLDFIIASGRQFIIRCDVTCDEKSRCIGIRAEVKPREIRTIFPVGTFNATITSIEYEQLRRYGGSVSNITKYAVYDCAILFKSYIDFFYQKRMYYKSTKDKTMDTNAKYFMNSLEGKLAQHTRRTTVINHDTHRDEGDHVIIDAQTGENVIIHVYGGKEWVTSREREEGYNVFVAIPSFIRAYTRILLWEDFNTIWRAGGEVYYCDCDSIFCNEKAKDSIFMKLSNDRLGAYKVEGISEGVIIHGCKDYIFDGTAHIKGIRKDAIYENGAFKQTHFCRMSAMLQRGIGEGVIIVDDFEKRPKRIYLKGIVPAGGGWIQPLSMQI